MKTHTFVLDAGVYTNTLPPLHTVRVPVSMDMSHYETMRKDFVLEFSDEMAIAQNAAVVTQKLQQLAAGFVYGSEARWLSSHKLDAIEDIISENQRAPTIVWYQYIAEKDALTKRFPQARTVDEPGIIDAWNQGTVEILLAHPASAGHGLNLQDGGCRMIWMSLPWSAELYEQAVGRLHRSGQRHDVWCYIVQTTGTVDERIWSALQDKRSLSTVALECLR
jgi:SNF2 family DNA or RNA helicase